jgi:hypothetical protein
VKADKTVSAVSSVAEVLHPTTFTRGQDMISKILRAALLAGVALAGATPTMANNAWGNYHWAKTGSTLPLKVNTAVTSQWTSYVGFAITTDWNGRSLLRLTNQSAPGGTSAKRCSPITGQVLVCNDSYGNRGWLGIASITADASSHITSGTTKLNDSYFNTAQYNKPEWRAMVACQEIGHDFGLGHQDEAFGNVNLGSCMDYTNAPQGGVVGGFNYGPSKEHPNTHDTDELNIIYGHADGYTTSTAATNFGVRQVGKAVPQALPAAGETRAEWGTATHRDGKGRPDMFSRSLPGGGKQLTHVFWALDATGHEAD